LEGAKKKEEWRTMRRHEKRKKVLKMVEDEGLFISLNYSAIIQVEKTILVTMIIQKMKYFKKRRRRNII
jgi:hypothetical protein